MAAYVRQPSLSVELSPPLFSPDETSADKTLSISIGYLAALGGNNPIVPFRDFPNRWKDRRVESVLVM